MRERDRLRGRDRETETERGNWSLKFWQQHGVISVRETDRQTETAIERQTVGERQRHAETEREKRK